MPSAAGRDAALAALSALPAGADGDDVCAAIDGAFPGGAASVPAMLCGAPSPALFFLDRDQPGPDTANRTHEDVTFSSLSHADVLALVESFPAAIRPLLPPALAALPSLAGLRTALRLPDPLAAALAVVACASFACAAPVSPEATWAELKAECGETGCAVVLLGESAEGFPDLPPGEEWAELGVVLVATFGVDLAARRLKITPLWTSSPAPIPPPPIPPQTEPCRRDDVVLVLRTSGSTGAKKIVPYTLQHLLVGAICIVRSWGLAEADRCVNVMPLFHVGGILRNLLAPLLSRSATYLLPGFLPRAFWAALRDGATWYYAGPALHRAICDSRPPGAACALRMAANASGPLTEELRGRMVEVLGRDNPGLVVLPSYGMTECMPISTPPADYSPLRHPRTSGVPCGPRVAILSPTSADPLPPGATGRICVRGWPLVAGYERPGTYRHHALGNPLAPASPFPAPFLEAGWFDTGDLGFLSPSGHLHVTGRTKECVNRGGETLAPAEIEEAVAAALGMPVGEVVCFAVPDARLGEVPGVLVEVAEGGRRPGLAEVRGALEGRLHPAKWPAWVGYGRAPRNGLGKVVRVGLGRRVAEGLFGGGEVDADAVPGVGRHFLLRGGEVRPVAVDAAKVAEAVRATDVRVHAARVVPVAECGAVAPPGSMPDHLACAVWVPSGRADARAIREQAAGGLHGYEIPWDWFVLDSEGADAAMLALDDAELLAELRRRRAAGHGSPTLLRVQRILATLLPGGPHLAADQDIFAHGADSMIAGLLAARLRRELGVRADVGAVFRLRTPGRIAEECEARLGAAAGGGREAPAGFADPDADVEAGGGEASPLLGRRLPRPSPAAPLPMLVHLLPAFVFLPLLTWLRYMLWIFLLAQTCRLSPRGRLGILELLASLAMGRVAWDLARPVLGVAFKWAVVGRYREGRYPVWGGTYLRWWITRRVLELTGKGVFTWFDGGVRLYHILLGAKIGQGTKISKGADISEHDLVEIGADVCIDAPCSISPFAFSSSSPDKGSFFVFRAISIGDRCSLAPRTVVVSGHTLPADTCLGPCTSSHHLGDAHRSYRDYCRESFPSPSAKLRHLVGGPILLIRSFLASAPWIVYALVLTNVRWFAAGRPDGRSVPELLTWFASHKRLLLYFLLLLPARTLLPPFLKLAHSLLVKRLLVGRFEPGPRDFSGWGLFRHWLMRALGVSGSFHGVTHLIGTHYGFTSFLFRLYGAKVGERVYWPGSGMLGLYEFDLWEVGDDVVFGSRSVVLPFDAREGKPIRLGAGSMVADRCVLLPGVTLGKNSCLGTGGLGAKDLVLEPGARALGAAHGEPVRLHRADDAAKGDEDTVRPFGRAFYLGEADYFVWPEWMHAAFNVSAHVVLSLLRRLPLFMALRVGLRLARRAVPAGAPSPTPLSLLELFSLMDLPSDIVDPGLAVGFATGLQIVGWFALCFLLLKPLMTLLFLCLDVAIKWFVVGRREPGKYNWDSSSYCQRWNLYLVLSKGLRRTAGGNHDVLALLGGSQYIVWYFRSLGATIGRDVCLYPNHAQPPMTEPDVVTIGDGALVDDASLVGHLNSMGQFSLNPVSVGAHSVLKLGSRVLSGGSTEDGAVLEEMSLVMSGDSATAGEMWVGWPPRI
ncbi:hypothetical protein DFJ74DRAFT_707339 [Hyaloraphidium curvatum]|nr:hypothetical protein DFJ74DRAFT_707339 [Hyaloraphidium curvatum]